MNIRNEMLEAARAYYGSALNKHRINIEILLEKGVGVAEHPDVMETIDGELSKMAEHHDRLEMLDIYFTKDGD